MTWWNVYAANKKLELPPCDFGPLLYFAGSFTGQPKATGAWYMGDMGAPAAAPAAAPEGAAARRLLQAGGPGWEEEEAGADDGSQERVQAFATITNWCAAQRWRVEQVDPGKVLYPSDLYAAQLAARRSKGPL